MPKLPLPAQPPTVTAPPDSDTAANDGTVLLPELKGVVFVATPAAVRRDGLSPESVPGAVAAPDLPLLWSQDFLSEVRRFVGRPLTRADLNAIARIARERYRSNERPFIEVSVPEQNVQGGVVQILVTEYRVGHITTEGNRHFSEKLILKQADLESGDVLTLPALNEALSDYNRNPFINATAVVKAGDETGLSDIALQVEDRFPLRVYAGYDNQGARTLGRDEWYAGFNWGNAFGLGHILSYQYTRSFTGNYHSHSLSDVVPIDGDTRLWLFGGYSTQTPAIAPDFASEGHSGQFSVRYMRDIGWSSSLTQNIQFGADYMRTDNNLDFGRFRLLDTVVELIQFPFTYSANANDRHGSTVIENLIVYSPGDLTSHNNDESLQLLVPDADATYVYDRFSVTRTTFIGGGASWIARGMVQLASDNLPYSEQIGGGGLGGVRGYDPNVAFGSNGILLSQEVRLPAFSVGKWFGGEGGHDQMQVGVFVDYAYLTQPTEFLDIANNVDLASVGLTLRYNISNNLDLRVDVGTQLIRAPGARDRETQAAVAATVSF